jgi:site-specific recombinase XerC
MAKEVGTPFDDEPRRRSGHVLIADLKSERKLAFKDGLLDDIQRQYRNDPHRQVQNFFMRFKIPAGTGRVFKGNGEVRTVSEATKDSYLEIFHWILVQLSELGMPLRNMTEFGPKHVRHLLKKMVADEMSASRIQSVITKARRWCVWIGKAEAVPALSELVAELGLAAETGKRKYGASTPKTLRSKGIDFEVVLARAEKRCTTSAIQLGLQVLFGLRRKESMFLEPRKCVEGAFLHVRKGAKGGHERRIPIRTEQQRAWLERAKVEADKHPKKILSVRPIRSFKQAARHLNYVCEAIGLTGSGEFGTTPHGLRHEYLCRRYEEITGSLPPVEGGVPVDPDLHDKAAAEVIKEAGHHAPTKIQSYIGNYNEFAGAADRNVKALYARMTDPRVQSELRELGLTGLLLVGEAADGVVKADAITVCAYQTQDTVEAREFVEENYDSLIVLLQMLVGTRVEIVLRNAGHAASKHTLEIPIEK